MSPEGKKVCVTCYKIYMNKEKLYGRRTSTLYIRVTGKAKIV